MKARFSLFGSFFIFVGAFFFAGCGDKSLLTGKWEYKESKGSNLQTPR